MMKKTIIFISLTSILLFVFIKTVSIGPVEAAFRTWTVDDDGPADFTKIQDAIDAASPYDIIQVATGTYHEHLSINTQNLTIIGEDPSNTIIEGDGTGSVIFLTAYNVTITGFTMQNGIFGINMNHASNCTIDSNVISSNEDDGLRIWWESNNNTIYNNIIRTNGDHGIKSEQCSQNTIRNNLLVGNEIGMLLSNCRYYVLRENNMTGNVYNFGVFGSSPEQFIHDIDVSNVVDEKSIYYLIGQSNLIIDPSAFPNLGYLALVNSENIAVRNLDLASNYQGVVCANTTGSFIEDVDASRNLYGIHFVFSSYNTVSNNLVEPNVEGVTGIYVTNSKHNLFAQNAFDSCQTGIYLLSYSSNNTIVENEVTNNQNGILIQAFSSGNLVYHNNFINNTQQVAVSSHSPTTWDNGYPLGGNFWSNYAGADLYNGPDQNETGSDGIGDTPYIIDANNRDNYPLMNPWTQLWGDIDDDGDVDGFDLTRMCGAYGSTPGDPAWDEPCDINRDGVIDGFDLTPACGNYGKTT